MASKHFNQLIPGAYTNMFEGQTIAILVASLDKPFTETSSKVLSSLKFLNGSYYLFLPKFGIA